MDINNLEQFIKTGAKLSNYLISINKGHSFGFNSAFYHKHSIQNYLYVVLFYDNKDKSIAFLFTNDNEALGKFTITHSDNKTSASITARSFFANYNLEINELVGKYIPQLLQHPVHGEMFFIELNKKII